MWTFLASNWALPKHYNNSTEHCSLPSILQPPKHPSASQTSCSLQTAAFNLQTEASKTADCKACSACNVVTIGGVSGGGEWRPQPGARRTVNIPPQSCEVTPGVSKGEEGDIEWHSLWVFTFNPSIVKSLLDGEGGRVTLSDSHFETWWRLHSN